MGKRKRTRFKKFRMRKREQAKQTTAKRCALSEAKGWAARHGRQRVCGQRNDLKKTKMPSAIRCEIYCARRQEISRDGERA